MKNETNMNTNLLNNSTPSKKGQKMENQLEAATWPKTTLSMKTLVAIARDIEREHKVTMPGSVKNMWTRLANVAGSASTKAEARELIAYEIYDLNN